MGDFRKLLVWQKAHELAIDIDRISKRIRGSNYASLRNQMLRSAMSIPANLVEGNALRSSKDFSRFIVYAQGSAAELEYHLLIAKDVHAISEADYFRANNNLTEVRKMMHGLLKGIRRKGKLD